MFGKLIIGAFVAGLVAFMPQRLSTYLYGAGGGGGGNLTASDITYDSCYYIMDDYLDVDGNSYIMGITFREVSGDPRLIMIGLGSGGQAGTIRGIELNLAGKNCGDTITTSDITHNWPLQLATIIDTCFVGCSMRGYWDEAHTRYWLTQTVNYGPSPEENVTHIITETLNSDNTVSDYHHVSLEDITAKQVFTGVVPIPASFQATYGTGPFAVGFGGSTSLASQSSVGPVFIAIPDPADYANNATIPATDFIQVMNSIGPGNADWYADGHPTTFDRGRTLINDVENYSDNSYGPILTLRGTVDTSGTTVTLATESQGRNFSTCVTEWPTPATCWWIAQSSLTGHRFVIDGSNYTVASYTDSTHVELTTSPGTHPGLTFNSPEPFPPVAFPTPIPFAPSDFVDGTGWTNPAPDGYGRMNQTSKSAGSCWFDGAKKGFLTLQSLGKYQVAYVNASLSSVIGTLELDIWNPSTIGTAINTSQALWSVYPDDFKNMSNGLPLGTNGTIRAGEIADNGMACDYTHNKIYVFATNAQDNADTGHSGAGRIYRFSVNMSEPTPLWPVALAVVPLGFAWRRRTKSRHERGDHQADKDHAIEDRANGQQ